MLKNHWFLKDSARARGWIFRFFYEKVVRFHMFYWHRIWKLLKAQCVWKDFDMRARRPRRCALCVIFCKGWWPSQARRRCWSSSRWAQKLPSKPRWIGMSKKQWFWKDSACARGQIFSIFGWESGVFSYVFLTSHLEIVEITVCLEGFRHARAAAAAMCTLPYFLQGIREIWWCKNKKCHFLLFFARESR